MLASFAVSLNQMAILFLLVIVGWVAAKLKLITPELKGGLTKIVLYITTPASILDSVLTSDSLPDVQEIFYILIVSFLFYVGVLIFALLLTWIIRVPKGSRGSYITMTSFSNCGFIGFPVVLSLFGSSAVFYAAVYNIPFHLLLYTLGPIMMARDGAAARRKGAGKARISISVFFSPTVIACVIAAVMAVFRVSFPDQITSAISYLGDVTTPMALMVVGASIAGISAKEMLGSPRIYAMAAARLLIIPLLTWVVFSRFVANTMLTNVAVVIAAMPVAAVCTMLAMEHSGDVKAITQGIFITTLLSVVTIPLLATLLL